MVDFNEIQNALNSEEKEKINVTVVTLSGTQNYEVEEGMTVRNFKARYSLTDVKIVNDAGDILTDNDTLDTDMELFISTPKKNG